MLDPAQWESTLASVYGTIFRGTERVSCQVLFNRLGIAGDKEHLAKMGKRLVTIMRQLGWTGPRQMRIEPGSTARGYWRLPCRPPGGEIRGDVASLDILPDELPEALEQVTRKALRKLSRVLNLPTDAKDGNLLRAQVTAAGIAINAQLRADEQRLRAKVTGDVLERLLAAIERERRKAGGELGEIDGAKR